MGWTTFVTDFLGGLMGKHQLVPPPLQGSAGARLSELSPEVFENFCAALVRAQPGINSADLHGKRGQADQAVDIIGRRQDGKVELFQCKRYAEYKGSHLRTHVAEFKERFDDWSSRGDIAKYVLIVSCSIDDVTVHRELENAAHWFLSRGVVIEIWSSGTIMDKLRGQPQLVRRFFDEWWVAKLCDQHNAATAEDKLRECVKCMTATDFRGALGLAREALVIAKISDDREAERKALRAVLRNLDHMVVSGDWDSESSHLNLITEMGAHIQALEACDADVGLVALERASLARLQGASEKALEFARIAVLQSGDTANVKAEALLVELQVLWQLKRNDEGLELAADVEALLKIIEDDRVRLQLAATWLMTFCSAGSASASGVESLVQSVQDMVVRDGDLAKLAMLLLSDVAGEFANRSRFSEARQLCLEIHRLAVGADDPWRAGMTALDVARVAGEINLREEARQYLGEAERWFEITRQREISDPEHRTRWIAGLANGLKIKGEISLSWARGESEAADNAHSLVKEAFDSLCQDQALVEQHGAHLNCARVESEPADTRHSLLMEAFDAFSQALALVEKHGRDLPGNVELYSGECHCQLAVAALGLGRHDDASVHFRQVRSPARMATPSFKERFGSQAALGEAQALAFGGKVNEARSVLTDMLSSHSLSANVRHVATKKLAWLENSILPVANWYGSDGALAIRDQVARDGLRRVVADQMSPLLKWFETYPGELGKRPYSELIDVWGRGGFARIVAAIKASPLNAIVVDAISVKEISRWVRVFCPLYDTVVINWKGEMRPSLGPVPLPEDLSGGAKAGGQGYCIMRDKLEGVDGFLIGAGWANFLPAEVSTFLATRALPLIRSGRLVVLPAPLVGCTQSTIGWTDNLLVDNLFGGVVTVAGMTVNDWSAERPRRLLDLATVRIPFVDGIDLGDLDTVLDEMADWLSPLRRLLRTSVSGHAVRQERWEQMGPCFDDIRDACRQLEERWRSLATSGAAASWHVDATTSTFSVGERGVDAMGTDPLTDFLRATTMRLPEIGPWIPFWRLSCKSGKIAWANSLDNKSTPPTEIARIYGFGNSIGHGWLYPGSGGAPHFRPAIEISV